MADNNNSAKPPTHKVYTFRRLGRKSGCWEVCGDAWLDEKTRDIGAVIRMLPVGGFTGLVQCRPIPNRSAPATTKPSAGNRG